MAGVVGARHPHLGRRARVGVLQLVGRAGGASNVGAIVPSAEVIDWMVAKNRLPELGLMADWARDGILVAVGNSGLNTGAFAGALGADILNGADPATEPIIDPKQTDTNFNLARARGLGIEFPPSELAAADTVFEAIGGR